MKGNDDAEQQVHHALTELGIEYRIHHHPAVYTVEEAKNYWADIEGVHPKNLFLRNEKGNRHYLVILRNDKRADLKELQKTLGSSRLSFASERRLLKYLGLTPGSVSGFGIIHDEERKVAVVIDEDLLQHELINFHPNVNTATLTLRTVDFLRFLEAWNHPYKAIGPV